jgi:hypothetical protein
MFLVRCNKKKCSKTPICYFIIKNFDKKFDPSIIKLRVTGMAQAKECILCKHKALSSRLRKNIGK